MRKKSHRMLLFWPSLKCLRQRNNSFKDLKGRKHLFRFEFITAAFKIDLARVLTALSSIGVFGVACGSSILA